MDIETVAEAVTVNIGMSLGKILPVIAKNPPLGKEKARGTRIELLRVADELESADFPGAALFVSAVSDGLDAWIAGTKGFIDPEAQ